MADDSSHIIHDQCCLCFHLKSDSEPESPGHGVPVHSKQLLWHPAWKTQDGQDQSEGGPEDPAGETPEIQVTSGWHSFNLEWV